MPKVSVVIPVYNVEQHIERCLHSLFCQTLEDIEFIFVNDCTTDASVSKIMEVMESYPSRKRQIQILKHDTNRGVAAARITGIMAATGDYIIHCDPDDYVECNMYELLYDKAIKTDADIVACYYWQETGEEKMIVKRPYYTIPQKCLKYMYKEKHDCGFLWDKLIQRSLIVEHHIVPFEGIDYSEDLNCIVRALFYARSLAVVKKPLYHYCRYNYPVSMSQLKVLGRMHIQSIEQICCFLKEVGANGFSVYCNYLKFYVKMKYKDLLDLDERDWFYFYRESHADVLHYTEDSLKSRFILWLALKNYKSYQFMKKHIKGL